MSTPAGRDARIAQRLGDRYELLDLLGRGGFAAVYRVRNLRLHRIEALKVLSENLSEDPDFARRFEQEARVSAALDHPNIVKIYDYGTAEDFVWFSMQFIDGPSLGRELKRRGRTDEPEAARIAIGVLDALDYSHRRGVVHRDVKPDNVLLDPNERVFLTDFGIAKSQAGLVHTHAGLLLGSPGYMSPEQLQGRMVDGRSDLYSLGVTLYRAVAGEAPFAGDDSFQETLRRLNEPPPPLSSKRPGVHPGFEAIVLRALDRDPDRRFASAREMGEAMADFLDTITPSRPRGSAAESESAEENTPTRPLMLSTLVLPAAPASALSAPALASAVPPAVTPAAPAPVSVEAAPAASPRAAPPSRFGRGLSAGVVAAGALAAALLAAALLLRRAPTETSAAPAARPPLPTARLAAVPTPIPAPAAAFAGEAAASAEPSQEVGPPANTPPAARAPRPTRLTHVGAAPRPPPSGPAAEPVPEVRRARVPPQLETQALLSLSAEARAAHGNESVGLSVTVGVDGSVRNARVISEACPECDRAALETVRRFRFRPARDAEGNPIEATIAISIRIPSL